MRFSAYRTAPDSPDRLLPYRSLLTWHDARQTIRKENPVGSMKYDMIKSGGREPELPNRVTADQSPHTDTKDCTAGRMANCRAPHGAAKWPTTH